MSDATERALSLIKEVPLSVVVESNKEAWDNYGEPIDLKNLQAVREHAARKVLKAIESFLMRNSNA